MFAPINTGSRHNDLAVGYAPLNSTMISVTHAPRAPSKLVRDKIPDIIRASGRQPSVRHLNDLEYKAALDAKLLEEAAELFDSSTPATWCRNSPMS